MKNSAFFIRITITIFKYSRKNLSCNKNSSLKKKYFTRVQIKFILKLFLKIKYVQEAVAF